MRQTPTPSTPHTQARDSREELLDDLQSLEELLKEAITPPPLKSAAGSDRLQPLQPPPTTALSDTPVAGAPLLDLEEIFDPLDQTPEKAVPAHSATGTIPAGPFQLLGDDSDTTAPLFSPAGEGELNTLLETLATHLDELNPADLLERLSHCPEPLLRQLTDILLKRG